MRDRRLNLCAILALAAAACPGCIERALTVESDPPGAAVRLNGRAVGQTPMRVRFLHYGVYEVELRKEGYATIRVEADVLAPGYARFPLCLLTELLAPFVIRDERVLKYRLAPPAVADRAGLLERAARATEGR